MTPDQIEAFIRNGYCELQNAFSQQQAAACREILWKATGYDRNDSATWAEPVVRLGEIPHPAFVEAANTPQLLKAFDQLAGTGHWIPKSSLGTFPLRFPSQKPANDDGWHVDASFAGDKPDDYFAWRVNVNSKGRALLMLFLFTDVGIDDAPTRLRAGSHLEIAAVLKPYGDVGLSFMELAQKIPQKSDLPEVVATGQAGTAYLCHPFLVHAAQAHRGKNPKFMAQPTLTTAIDFNIHQPYEKASPVEKAIIAGLRA